MRPVHSLQDLCECFCASQSFTSEIGLSTAARQQFAVLQEVFEDGASFTVKCRAPASFTQLSALPCPGCAPYFCISLFQAILMWLELQMMHSLTDACHSSMRCSSGCCKAAPMCLALRAVPKPKRGPGIVVKLNNVKSLRQPCCWPPLTPSRRCRSRNRNGAPTRL